MTKVAEMLARQYRPSRADPGPTEGRPLEIVLQGLTPERLGWTYRPIYLAISAYLERRFGNAMLTRAYDGHDRVGCRTWVHSETDLPPFRLRIGLLLSRLHKSEQAVAVRVRLGTE